MIRLEVVHEIPLLEEFVSDKDWFPVRGPLRSMSTEVYLIYEDETPLLLIGGYRNSLIDTTLELWMLPTKHLGARHLRTLKRMWTTWRNAHRGKVFARAKGRKECRFLEWMDWTVHSQDGAITTYEVSP